MASTKIPGELIAAGAINATSIADTSITPDKLHTSVAQEGLHSNSSGIRVLANNGLLSNSSGTFVVSGTGVTSNSTGVHIGQDVSTTSDVTFANVTQTASIVGTHSITANTTHLILGSAKIDAVDTAIANLVASAPGTLDTLNEIATALGSDPDLANTLTTSIATKAPLANPTFTGNATFDTSTLFVDGTNDRVGVGTTSPDRKVNIIGDSTSVGQYPLSLDATNTDYTLEFRRNGTSEWWIAQSGGAFRIHENGVGDHFHIDTGGYVGIGTSTPKTQLEVNGGVVITGRGNTNNFDWKGMELFYWSNTDEFFIETYDYNTSVYKPIKFNSSSYEFSSNGNVKVSGKLAIKSSNSSYSFYSDGNASYAGVFYSTQDAQIRLEGDSWAGIQFADGGGNDYVWFWGTTGTYAIGGGGSTVTGKKLHVHGATTIGSGLPGQQVSTNGLAVEGHIAAKSGLHNILNKQTKDEFNFTGYPNTGAGSSVPKNVADEINSTVSADWPTRGYQTAQDGSSVAYIKVDCLQQYRVTAFAVTGYPGGSHRPSGRWYLYGSNDNSTWTQIGSANKNQWRANTQGSYPFHPTDIVMVDSPGDYRYYKVEATGWTNGYLLMYNWGLFTGSVVTDIVKRPNHGMAMLRADNSANSSITTLISNNNSFIDLATSTWSGAGDWYSIRSTYPFGINILRAGSLHIMYTQDIRTSGSGGYITTQLCKNGSVINSQLITNTNSEWDCITNNGVVPVAEGDYISISYQAADILSFDTTDWSSYTFIWMASDE